MIEMQFLESSEKMKRFIYIVLQITILYVFYLIGIWIKTTLGLSVPGSVIGLLLLFALLTMNVVKVKWIEAGSQFFIKHLVFFFIPATVGVIDYFDLFKGKGTLLVFIGLISTVLVMGVSGLISQFLVKDKAGEEL